MILVILSISLLTPSINAKEPVEIESKNYILYNLNEGTILLEKDADEKIAIASMTKIMTTILAIEKIEDMEKKVILTNNVFEGLKEENASVAGFKVGQTVTYEDLLYGALLPSGADATRALAINLSGSVNKFVEEMNEKAKELGLSNTHYVNENGLDIANHYSSVRDVATLFQYALKNKTFNTIVKKKNYTTSDGKIHMQSTLEKTKDMYKISADYILGGKTGYTDDAGLCLASIARYNDIDYMLITARAPDESRYPYHILDAKKIYEYYFKNYGYQTIIEKGQPLAEIKTKYSKIKKIDIKMDKTITKYLPNDYDKEKIKLETNLVKEVKAKTKPGTNLGTIQIYYDGERLHTLNITLQEEIPFDLIEWIKVYKWPVGLTAFIATFLLFLIIRKIGK